MPKNPNPVLNFMAHFPAHFSSAGRIEPCRYDARGCTHPKTVVERWNGKKWIEVTLTWTGSKYEEIA